MAYGDPYIDVEDLKAYITGLTGTSGNDVILESSLGSVSAEIEAFCGRQFNKPAGDVVSTRLFAPDSWHTLTVDDFYTTGGLVVEVDAGGSGTFTALDPADFELEPVNGIVDGRYGWPYNRIRLVGGTRFPTCTGRRKYTVRVTAAWGWAAVPEPVKTACRIMAEETWKLKDAPFGVLGLGEFGVVRVRQNKMAASKLAPYCLSGVMVG
ncbi:hypothetical protein [Streptomyces sp. NPDC055085]